MRALGPPDEAEPLRAAALAGTVDGRTEHLLPIAERIAVAGETMLIVGNRGEAETLC